MIFTLTVVLSAGMFLSARTNNVFYNLITSTQENYFQQSVIGFNEYYKQISGNIRFMKNSEKLRSMLIRYDELTRKEKMAALTYDETHEKFLLMVDIREFLKRITVQESVYSLHYGKSPAKPVFLDIAVFFRETIVHTTLFNTGGFSSPMTNIFGQAEYMADGDVRLISQKQLNEMGVRPQEEVSGAVFNIESDGRLICSVVMILPKAHIKTTIQNIDDIVVVNKEGDILFTGSNISENDLKVITGEQSQTIDSSPVQRDDIQLFKKAELGISGVFMYYKFNADIFEHARKQQQLYLFAAMTASILLLFLISRIQTGRIISPVVELNKKISEFPGKLTEMKSDILQAKPKRYSLHERLTYYFTITIILPFLLFIIAGYLNYMKELNRFIDEYTRSMIETESEIVSNIIDRKAKSFFMLINEKSLWDNLTNGDMDESKVSAMFEQAVYMGIGNSRVMLMEKNGELLFYSGMTLIDMVPHQDEFPDIFESMFPIKWRLGQNLIGEYTLSLMIPAFSFEDIAFETASFITHKGWAILNIGLREIKEIFFGFTSFDRNIYLEHENGMIFDLVRGTDAKSILDETANKNRIVLSDKINNLDWNVITVFSKDSIDSFSSLIRIDFIYCLFIVVLLSIIYSFIISNIVLKPVNRLNYYFNTAGLDSVGDIDINKYFIDEIDTIGINFVSMMERINQLVDELLLSQFNVNELNKKGRSAQFTALQAQITPHFLYNTLDTTIHLIGSRQAEKAISTIQALSDLFRYSLAGGESIITVEEEIKYTVSYTKIIEIRHKDDICFRWDTDPGIERCECVRMILQPLIENCVLHAYDNRRMTIEISCRISGDNLVFSVRDNGKGMTGEELAALLERIRGEKLYHMNIGLNNVFSRLRLIYDEDCGIDISSCPGEGSEVTIRMPARLKI